MEKPGQKECFRFNLHLGIYIYPDGTEMSINPYAILKYAEQQKTEISILTLDYQCIKSVFFCAGMGYIFSEVWGGVIKWNMIQYIG